MIVVGIHNTGITSSAALVVDGELRFACAEERLDRRKYSRAFPHRAIAAGLEHVGAGLDDVAWFAVGWNPGINIAGRTRAGHSDWPAWPGERFHSNPNQLLPRLTSGELVATDQTFHRQQRDPVRICYVAHHLAHAANAYFLSGFDEAAVFTCDGHGERATTAWFHAQGGRLRLLREIRFPHSIGMLYSTLTRFLGFRSDLDEWKVMGASAYGDAARYRERLRELVRFDDDANLELDLRFFQHYDFDAPLPFTPALCERLGPARRAEEPLEARHFDLSAALQELTEDYLTRAVRWIRRTAGCSDLCLSGGVLMNSVWNGKAACASEFRRLYVPFAPDDSGNSIGAALWTAHREGERLRAPGEPASPFLGRAYEEAAIRRTLDGFRLRYEHPADVCEAVAELLAGGSVVGWFQGRMEFGQRALGGRSILGDPRDPDMKDRINRAVKFRESFRPFAPAVLVEEAAGWFEMPDFVASPYMEKVLRVRTERARSIPAVVHADGSGRLQTVDRKLSPRFHQLIRAFRARTGAPVVLNTSFNLNEEPIVESPADAIRTYASSGLDALAIGPYLLRK